MLLKKGKLKGSQYRFYLPKDLFGEPGIGGVIWVEVAVKDGVVFLTPKSAPSDSSSSNQ
jgi:hypothetical protein